MAENFINEFESEIINLNMTTICRLFELSSDAACLYLFYAKNAKLQKTNSIYATNNFAQNGLGWSQKKFYDTKKILIDNGFISKKTVKDNDGKITKHYITLHYLKFEKDKDNENPYYGIPIVWESNSQNASNKKINASNKNVNNKLNSNEFNLLDQAEPDPEDKKIIEHWNKYAKNFKGITIHSKIESKYSVSLDKSKSKFYPLINIVNFYKKKHPTNFIYIIIDNYFKILSSSDYWYNYKFKNLANFISSPSIQQFEDISKFSKKNSLSDPFADARLNTQFISKSFDPKSPLNKQYNTYMGIRTKILLDLNVLLLYNEDIRPYKSDLQWGRFIWLEEGIIALIYRKENVELLSKLLNIHSLYADQFKKKIEAGEIVVDL